MSLAPKTEQQGASFAETALRLGGKSDEEVRRTGAMDLADEQLEELFAARRRTAASPVHRAVWDGRVPLDLFAPPPLPASAPCDAAMERCLAVVRGRRDTGTLYDDQGKLRGDTVTDLARAGFFGMLIPTEYGGQGAPFARFARFHTRLATLDGTVAGLGSVHSCIGAVDPVRTFGTAEQKSRLLPKLASGQALSAFALTEPCAGSDLTALRTTAVEVGDELEITGEKLFITSAKPGGTIGLVVMLKGKPAVVVADLPPQENDQFQVVRYGLYALRHSHNTGLRFRQLRVPRANLLTPPLGDGLTIAYHGLNRGRITLCAAASATMRHLLASILPWGAFRRTYGAAINTRELVKARIARLAALIAGADALTEWCAWLLDEGYRGELECMVAKVFGSEALKEAAVELLMKTHGGRSFLHGHLFGDNVHDFLAPCIYEGEGEMLGMGFFKTIAKEHGKQFFQPVGEALQRHGMKTMSPANPLHLWRLRRELGSYAGWWLRQRFVGRDRQQVSGMNAQLRGHVAFALGQFARHRDELSATMRKHQLKLADRQCRIAELSRRVQDTVVLLVAAQWGHRQANEVSLLAADLLCRDLRRKLTGARPDDDYFRDAGRLADRVIAGGVEPLTGVKPAEILMPYQNW
jgi:alkylation response protein AidB-like acyl-CoA dehydrogenase